MKIRIIDFYKICLTAAALFVSGGAFAAQPVNSRAALNTHTSQRNSVVSESRRVSGANVVAASGTNVGARSATPRNAVSTTGRAAAKNVVATTGRSGILTVRPVATHGTLQGVINSARVGTTSKNVVRSATVNDVARGTTSGGSSVARSARARATAVFDDVSKMGTGYTKCRDAYSTCMDQLCAKANDTYRRCFCSARYSEFRNTESALDQAKSLLMQFEDNNLNAVDKTAAEVDAMYSATIGEAAIKRDTSAAQKTLDEIADLLSGRKKVSTPEVQDNSLGLLSFNLGADIDDIWGASTTNSIFGNSQTSTDISQMEGQQMYDQANSACLKIVADSCENAAVLNMARSSYSILISQDCNTYEKKIEGQREAVKQTVRQAEKYLREARLENYREHNSPDVNQCLDRVRSAILADTACGANYKRCLDNTGLYINQATGDVIYSPRLFDLTNLIDLANPDNDKNAKFQEFLETKKMYAATALDTCRDLADVVWSEFKRTALIEIAQAQDEKLEQVKSSCVSTIKECYDTQTNALKSFATGTASAGAGALSAYAAQNMCADKVNTCAALYGGKEHNCTFNEKGQLNKESYRECGMEALLNFVDNVNAARIADGCASAIENYVKTELCGGASGSNNEYPWKCRLTTMDDVEDAITKYANINCYVKDTPDKNDARVAAQIKKATENIADLLDTQLMTICEDMNGIWRDKDNVSGVTQNEMLSAFNYSVYGGNSHTAWGACLNNTARAACLAYNQGAEKTVAKFENNECTFEVDWYQDRCNELGGYYENSVCYMYK